MEFWVGVRIKKRFSIGGSCQKRVSITKGVLATMNPNQIDFSGMARMCTSYSAAPLYAIPARRVACQQGILAFRFAGRVPKSIRKV